MPPARSPDTVVAVFARPCVPGSTKTRLAAAIGPEAAAQLARAFLTDTWAVVASRPWAHPVLTSPGEPVGHRVQAEWWPQPGGDLGERIRGVVARGLHEVPRVLVVGADSPTLPADLLDAARVGLEQADAMFIPAADGGFVALGLRRPAAEAFGGVRWSTAHAAADLAANLRGGGATVGATRPWYDVDVVADLDRLAVEPDLARRAPASARVLEELGRLAPSGRARLSA